MPHCLSVTEFSHEEFQYSLHLRYSLMPQDRSATCDGYGKKFLIGNTLSFPWGGLVLVHNVNAEK